MNAKSIYDKLVNIEGVPSSILTYSDKGDCIIIEVQDYDKSVFKFAREFFKGYKSVDIDYTNENKTIVWYNEVSEYSDRETIDSITRFYYDMKVKGLVESKKSTRKSIKESKNDIDFNNLNGFVNFKEYGDSSRGGGAFSEIKKLFEKESSFQNIVSLIKDLESDFELTKFTFSSNGEIDISFKEVGGNFEFFVKYEIVRSGIGLTNLRYF